MAWCASGLRESWRSRIAGGDSSNRDTSHRVPTSYVLAIASSNASPRRYLPEQAQLGVSALWPERAVCSRLCQRTATAGRTALGCLRPDLQCCHRHIWLHTGRCLPGTAAAAHRSRGDTGNQPAVQNAGREQPHGDSHVAGAAWPRPAFRLRGQRHARTAAASTSTTWVHRSSTRYSTRVSVPNRRQKNATEYLNRRMKVRAP